MLAAGWFDPCLVTFLDSFGIGGFRIQVFTSFFIAVSGVEDATAAIHDTRDNMMSQVPFGSHSLFVPPISLLISFGLFLYIWYKLLRFRGLTGCMLRGVCDDDLLCVPPVLEVQQVTLFKEPQSFVEVHGSSCSMFCRFHERHFLSSVWM